MPVLEVLVYGYDVILDSNENRCLVPVAVDELPVVGLRFNENNSSLSLEQRTGVTTSASEKESRSVVGGAKSEKNVGALCTCFPRYSGQEKAVSGTSLPKKKPQVWT
jgi:hypothetical protein